MSNDFKYKNLIFDFDGTIADSYGHIIPIVLDLASKYRNKLQEKIDLNDLRHYTFKEIITYAKFPKYKLPFIVKKAQNRLHLKLDEVQLFPGVTEVLEKLDEQGFKMGVISSNSENNVEKFLSQKRINSYFNFIIGSSALFGKQRSISRALKKYQLERPETLYIGDEVRDIEACKNSDIDVVAVTWGFNAKVLLKRYNPSYLVDTPEELYETITASTT